MSGVLALVPGKKNLETGVRGVYGKKTVHITNSPPVSPNFFCLGQVGDSSRVLHQLRTQGYPNSGVALALCQRIYSTKKITVLRAKSRCY